MNRDGKVTERAKRTQKLIRTMTDEAWDIFHINFGESNIFQL